MDYDGKTFNTVSQLGGTDLLPVNYFYCQGEDNIWFSTAAEKGDFIHHFDGSTLISYGEKDGLPSRNMYQFIKTIIEDSSGNLWFGASYEGKTGGLMKFDGTTWTTYTEDHGVTGKSINQIIEDKDGNIWVATNKGLNVFDGNQWNPFDFRDVYTTKFFEDSKGDMWVLSIGNGVFKYEL